MGVLLTGAAQEVEDSASLQQISEAIEEGLESLTQDDTEKEDETRPAIHTQSEEEASKESYVRTETQVSPASEGTSSSSSKSEISESRTRENRSPVLQNQGVSDTEATEGGAEEEHYYSLTISHISDKGHSENFSPVAKGELAEAGTALSKEEFNAVATTVCAEVVGAEPYGPLEQVLDDHSNEDSRLLAVEESETQTLGAKELDEVTKSQGKISGALSLPIRASAATVDKITENIWRDLLSDLATTVPPQLLRSGLVLKDQEEQEKRQQQQERQKSERQIATAKIVKLAPTAVSKSPTRSKPQDLMLTTFDISSSDSSGSSTDDKSPKVRLSTAPAATHSPDEDDNRTTEITAVVAATGVIIDDDDDDFYDDDDFGLSAIRHEAELLRLQELRVEAEIARIQREESDGKLEKIAASLRQIPDKPPPPYVPPPGQVAPPPTTTAAVIKPVRPPHPSRSFLPAGGEEIGGLVSRLAEKLFRMKIDLGSLEDLGDQLETIVEEELAARPGDLRKVSSFLRCFLS